MPGRWLIAHHEAGHVVGAWRAGIAVTGATVDPVGALDGATSTAHLSDLGAAGLRGAVLMLLAGGAAEKVFAERHGFDSAPWGGAERDILRALRLIGTFLPAAEAEDFLNDLVPATRDLVAAEWDVIETVARALFACGSMTGAELTRIARRR
jgi:hypothetical protein